MTKKKAIIIAITCITILAAYFLSERYLKDEPKVVWSVETVKVEKGWGYVISRNNTAIINQDIIPAISMRVPFSSKESADKVGKLVLDKINKKQIPSVSKKELKELGIVDSLFQPIPKK